jgi:tetratricopeptide (TPR) repeat protein
MWWAWPHLRRLWAGVGTLAAGLTVTYVYNLWSRQAVPDVRSAFGFIRDYWIWTGSALLALTAVSVVAERAHRRHEARAPQPLRIAKRSWRERFRGQAPSAESSAPPASTMVGRATELAKLGGWFAQVKAGSRRVVFVSGEPGIGKTTLTRAFVDSLTNDRTVRIGRGQCVEQYGAGEPYMPILEALTRLCREPGGDKLVEVLHRLAPAWLAQMPSLVTAEDRARLQGHVQGTTQQRMLREMAEALEVIAAESPLVMFIEDLHWSDHSTLDLIATIARRTEPARLMILGTYRPVEMLAGEHPLRVMKEEAELHQQCIELRLPLLSEADVAAYVRQRFASPASVASAVFRRSEGNPLFMVNVVEYLMEQGSLADADKIEAPHNIRQMIERNLQRLSPDEQRILEAASVTGAEFSAAAVAAALEQPMAEIEARCTRLSRQEQFINRQGSAAWPDGTVASAFRFRHALYQNVLYDRLPDGHRIEFHRRIAQREETGYGERRSEIASELANHYRKANAKEKAIEYFTLGGQLAIRRSASADAIDNLTGALTLLETLPHDDERDKQELSLRIMLHPALIATKGFGASEMQRNIARAREICGQLGDPPELFRVLYFASNVPFITAQLEAAHRAAAELITKAEAAQDRAMLEMAHSQMGFTLFHKAEFRAARRHLDMAISFEDPNQPLMGIVSTMIAILSVQSWILCWLGYPDQALGSAEKAITAASKLSHPHSVAFADGYASVLRKQRGEPAETLAAAEKLIRLSAEYGLKDFLAVGRGMKGWALAAGGAEEGIELVEQHLATARATGIKMSRPHHLNALAQVYMWFERFEKATAALDEALEIAEEGEDRFCEAETYLLRGELLLHQSTSNTGAAKQFFERAIAVAQKQSAKLFELRATTSLARLLRDTGRRDEAHKMLAEIYCWFTEGFDTRDLKEAKELLDELG